MLNTPDTPLLRSLEDLAALSSNSGLIEVKPFRDWDSSWKHKIFKMRLCNAGEMLDIGEFLSKYPGTVRDQALRIEILIRAMYTIDDQPLAPEEDVKKYNDTHNVDLSKLEYLRIWALNLEQVVLDRLYVIYTGLQAKQLRKMNNQLLCDVTGAVFDTPPDGAVYIEYSTSEILSNDGIEQINSNDIEVSHIYDVTGQEDTAVDEIDEQETTDSTEIPTSPPSDELKFIDQESGEEYSSHEEFLRQKNEKK